MILSHLTWEQLNKIDVSIIIPAYNAGRYLRKAVESCCKNDAACEIIIINDGSIDNTLEIANDLAGSNDAIKVIDKQNGGVSRARNAGLEYATGEWIMFVDADDVIPAGAVDLMLKSVEGHEDVYMHAFGIETIRDGNGSINPIEDRAYTCLEYKRDVLTYKTVVGPFAKLFNKRLFEIDNGIELKFPEDISIGEDLIFNLIAATKSGNIIQHKDIVYFYIVNSGSAMQAKDLTDRYIALNNRATQLYKTCILNDVPYDLLRTFYLINIFESFWGRKKYPSKVIRGYIYQYTPEDKSYIPSAVLKQYIKLKHLGMGNIYLTYRYLRMTLRCFISNVRQVSRRYSNWL